MKTKNYTKILGFTILTYCLTMLMGCGYTNPYNIKNELDKDGTGHVNLYLNMWKNNTNLLGYQATIQHDLILWFKKSNRFHITQDLAQADYVLNGTIHSIDQPALSYGAFDRATTIKAKVEFTYTLNDHETGKIIFKQPRLLKEESYPVGNDAVRTNSNLQKALGTMSESLADAIYIQMFYLFTLDKSKGDKFIIPTDEIKALD